MTLVVVTGLVFVAKWIVRTHRQAEEQARRLQAEEERKERLRAAKERFVLAVSHELRTPLTVVRGYLSMMEDGDIPTEVLQRAIHAANTKAAQMEELVKHLLEGFDPESSARLDQLLSRNRRIAVDGHTAPAAAAVPSQSERQEWEVAIGQAYRPAD